MMKPSEQAREQVKALMGITYSDPIEDQKIEWQMESCMADMVGAGVPVRLSAADLTGNAAQILADAAARSEALGESHCWPEQLLAALMRRSDCTAARWIGRFGAQLQGVL